MDKSKTEYGDLYQVPWDNFIGASLKEYGYYCNVEQKLENQLCGLLAATIEEPGVILDIGAHFGTMSLAMAHGLAQAPNRHTIVAVEPQPNNYAALCANLALNDKLFSPVIPINGAIIPSIELNTYDECTTIPLLNPVTPFNSGAVSLQEWENRVGSDVPHVDVPNYTVLNLLAQLALHRSDLLFVKADVEGTEAKIIVDILKHSTPVMFVECNTDDATLIMESLIEDSSVLQNSYDIHWICEPYYVDSVDTRNIWNREIWSVNLLFVPRWFKDRYAFSTDAPRFGKVTTVKDAIDATRKVVHDAQA